MSCSISLQIILSAVIVAVSSQWAAPAAAPAPGQWAAPQPAYRGDPSLARILSDQRAHHVAGDFKLAVRQEDGTNFQESAVSADGSRTGQYSYVDTNGQVQTTKWRAGKGGFQIIGANNQPTGPQQTAAYKAAADNLARQHQAARARVAEAQRLEALKPKPVQKPRPAQQRAPAQQYQQPQQQYAPLPQQQYAPQPKPQQYQAPQQQYAPVQQPIQQQQYVPTAAPPTQAPKRFFPPGQLSFSRNQLGYQYNFSS